MRCGCRLGTYHLWEAAFGSRWPAKQTIRQLFASRRSAAGLDAGYFRNLPVRRSGIIVGLLLVRGKKIACRIACVVLASRQSVGEWNSVASEAAAAEAKAKAAPQTRSREQLPGAPVSSVPFAFHLPHYQSYVRSSSHTSSHPQPPPLANSTPDIAIFHPPFAYTTR